MVRTPVAPAGDAARALLFTAAALGHSCALRLALLLQSPAAMSAVLDANGTAGVLLNLVAVCDELCCSPTSRQAAVRFIDSSEQQDPLEQQPGPQSPQAAAAAVPLLPEEAAAVAVAVLRGEPVFAAIHRLLASSDPDSATQHAARQRILAAMRLLLQAAPCLAAQATSSGCLPIHLAAGSPHCADVVAALLEAAPETAEQGNSNGRTACHAAAQSGSPQSLAAVLEAAPHLVWAQDNSGWLPIHHAALRGHVGLVHQLLAAGPGTSTAQSAAGGTLLHLAVPHP